MLALESVQNMFSFTLCDSARAFGGAHVSFNVRLSILRSNAVLVEALLNSKFRYLDSI